MTPTSKERHKVAERLRHAAHTDANFDVTIAVAILETIGEVRRPIASVVADFIDPTCTVKLKRVVVDEYYRHTRIIPTCSVCGSPLDGCIGFPRYCPGCGARVVDVRD